MTAPLSDTQLAAIRELRFLEGSMTDCASAAVAATRTLLREVDRLRELFTPAQLVEWAEQLQSADLTPHPAFAWCSTTSGYEAAFQVATTDRLTDAAREQLLTELRVAFDETVRRVLGYRPATAPTV